MDLQGLQGRVDRGESLHAEFKAGPVQPDDLAASLVAFANTDGGQLLVGVSDDGRIEGVPNPEAVARLVDNVAANNCAPPITVVQEFVKLPSSQTVLVVSVPQGSMRPYRTNRGVYYVRSGTGRRQASREELLRLFQAADSLYYDEMVMVQAHLSDLNMGAFEDFLVAVYGKDVRGFGVRTEQLLRNLRLAQGDHPTVAGLLLFGKRPQEFMPHAQVNAARVAGIELSASLSDREDIQGRLPDMLEASARFASLHLKEEHRIHGFERERHPELPEEAIRESLVNGLVHRDYTVGGPVRLLIFDDHLEVRTPGRPPNTVDVEAMRLGTHVPRNPILLSHLAKMGLVTSIGSGIPRILKLVPDADLLLRESEFTVLLPRKSG